MIRTNYLQFDSTSSLLGFGLAAYLPDGLPHPQVYGLGLLGKLGRTEGRAGPPGSHPGFFWSPPPGSSLWAVTLIKVL